MLFCLLAMSLMFVRESRNSREAVGSARNTVVSCMIAVGIVAMLWRVDAML